MSRWGRCPPSECCRHTVFPYISFTGTSASQRCVGAVHRCTSTLCLYGMKQSKWLQLALHTRSLTSSHAGEATQRGSCGGTSWKSRCRGRSWTGRERTGSVAAGESCGATLADVPTWRLQVPRRRRLSAHTTVKADHLTIPYRTTCRRWRATLAGVRWSRCSAR